MLIRANFQLEVGAGWTRRQSSGVEPSSARLVKKMSYFLSFSTEVTELLELIPPNLSWTWCILICSKARLVLSSTCGSARLDLSNYAQNSARLVRKYSSSRPPLLPTSYFPGKYEAAKRDLNFPPFPSCLFWTAKLICYDFSNDAK